MNLRGRCEIEGVLLGRTRAILELALSGPVEIVGKPEQQSSSTTGEQLHSLSVPFRQRLSVRTIQETAVVIKHSGEPYGFL